MRHFRHAMKDFRNHRFLHGITWMTIVLTVIMAGTFMIFAGNAGKVISSWEVGVKVMVYLDKHIAQKDIDEIQSALERDPDVSRVIFISKEKALETMRATMQRHVAIFQDLEENPLPDAFELHVKAQNKDWTFMEGVTKRLSKIKGVEDVEAGSQWIGRVLGIIGLLRMAALGIGLLFFFVSIFIVSNTIRLAFYSKKDEVEVMRLVGATESFIRTPYYIQSLLLGFTGGLFGIFVLYLIYLTFTIQVDVAFNMLAFRFSFLSGMQICLVLILCILVGFLGAYLSFRQENPE